MCAMVVTEKLLTVEEFWAQYADTRYELVKGVPVEMPPVSSEHGDIAATIAALLFSYLREHGLGRVKVETGYRLEEDTLRGPDISFVSREREAQIADPRKYVPFAPDLAVEVVSPDESAATVHDKIDDYIRAGVCLIWVIYPSRRQIVVHHPDRTAQILTAEDTLTGGEVIPGFAIPVKAVFGEE